MVMCLLRIRHWYLSDKSNTIIISSKKTIDEIIRERLAERSLTDSENHKAFVQIRNDLLRGKSEALGLACMLFTGIRPEEVIALDFGDIIPLPNSDTRIINVYKSYDTTNNKIDRPKTENGNRIISMHSELMNLYTLTKESLIKAGYKEEKEIKKLPFVSSSSDPTERCNYNTLREYAKEVLINAGVKQEIIILADILAQADNAQDSEPEPTTYLFRRSFATYARYYCGFTESELKYIMGHKDDSVDLPLYQVYCTNENQEEIKTKLEKWQVGTYTPGQKITPEDRTEEKQDEETSVLAKTSATNDDNQRDQILTTEEPDDDFNDNLMPTSEQPGDDYNDHQIPGNYIFLLTSEGRIRKTPISEYPRRSRNTSGVKGPDFKNNDYFTSGIKVSELDNIYVITDKGNIYLLSMLNIPVTNRTNIAKTATENIFKKNSEKIMIAIHDNRSIDNEECYLTTVTRFGRIQRTNVKFLKKLKPYSKDSDPAGIKLMTLNDGDSIVSAFFSNGNDNQDIIICTQKGKGICFSESAIRETGKNTKGISAINLSENDVCIGAAIAKHDGYLFTITKSGYGKCTSVINPGCWGGPQNVQNRGGRGKKAHNLDENGELAAMAVINRSSSEEIALISSDGHICRFKTEEIPISSRETSGSRLMNLRNSSNVSIINIIEI